MPIAAVLASIIVAAVGAWWLWRPGAATLQPGSCRGCNVLLITIDTLRVDRVGAFGGRAGLTPTLDALADGGVRFTRAYASAPLTLPSHASILTAVQPPVHGLRANGLFRLGPNLPTLATVLKGSGYRTGAFVGAFVLDARFGLNRGFDVYDDKYGEKPTDDPAEGAERRAEDVVGPAAAWIVGEVSGGSAGGARPAAGSEQRAAAPWFAWVHLYDPHEPYRAPEPYASRHEPYDAEVAYADAMVGKLLDDLRAAGRLDHTLVVVCADHGESLGEHGERTHGVFVYEATMRVPWIVSGFGVGGSAFGVQGSGFTVQGSGSSVFGSGSWLHSSAFAAGRSGAVVDRLVRLIDLSPTVLDLVGVQAPSSFAGRSAAAIAREGDRTAYVEAMDANLTRNWAPLTGLVTRDDKLIDLPIAELYDLRADPGETTNRFARDADRARTLASRLRDETSSMAAHGSAAEKTTLGAEARQRLQALGYVASSADAASHTYTDADDPKTLIGPANDLQQAVTAFNTGARADAMARVRAIAQAHPRFATAHGMLASMQRQTGDLAGAIATLEHLAKQGLADQHVLVVLAGYLEQAGNAPRALQVLDAVIAAHPDEVEAFNSRGVIAMRRGDHARARADFHEVLELDPTSARAYANLAADELSARELTPAIGDLQHALDLDPHLWDALYNLALALDAAGRRDEARQAAARYVRDAPVERYGREIAELRALAR